LSDRKGQCDPLEPKDLRVQVATLRNPRGLSDVATDTQEVDFEGSETLLDDGWWWSCRMLRAGQNCGALMELSLGCPQQCQFELSDP